MHQKSSPYDLMLIMHQWLKIIVSYFYRARLCRAQTMLWQDFCPSVCLSHTSIVSKSHKHIIKLFTPSGSHTILHTKRYGNTQTWRIWGQVVFSPLFDAEYLWWNACEEFEDKWYIALMFLLAILRSCKQVAKCNKKFNKQQFVV